MLKENQIIEVSWHSKNKQHYIDKGYKFTKYKEKFLVKAEDLSHSATAIVKVICDYCGEEYDVAWYHYVESKNKNQKNACYNCRHVKRYENDLVKRQKNLYSKALEICNRKGYVLVSKEKEIKNNNTYIEFICPIHGKHKMRINNLINGKECPKCNGSGRVYMRQQTIFGTTNVQTTCPECNGKGKVVTKKCPHCNGVGRARRIKDVEVTIPAGIDTGMTLRMEGYGGSGYNGGPSGDLYIQFNVSDHKVFKRNGQDIILEIPISFSQAALGDTIDVPTIDGNDSLKIPAGTQTGTKFRLRGKGTKNPKGGLGRGDQFVIVTVETPTNLTNEEKHLFEKLSDVQKIEKKSPWEKFKSLFNKD